MSNEVRFIDIPMVDFLLLISRHNCCINCGQEVGLFPLNVSARPQLLLGIEGHMKVTRFTVRVALARPIM